MYPFIYYALINYMCTVTNIDHGFHAKYQKSSNIVDLCVEALNSHGSDIFFPPLLHNVLNVLLVSQDHE